jgi:transcriptional regulator of acetoin/glycerol metabolism
VGVAREALTALAGRAWPGNVRQLEHALLQAWLLADGEILQPADFAEEPVAPRPAAAAAAVRTEEDRHARDRRLIVEALEATGWNRQAAAARLGIPRRTFYRRLEAYGILSPRSHGNA